MFRYWFVFTLLFLSKPLLAVEVADLYSAKVELSSQTQQDKNKALKAAMQAVLIKISGDHQVMSNTFIKKETQRYTKYLTQFNYITENDTSKLVASFDESKINQLFFQQNIPLWGSLRPLVLFWVVSEDGLSRRIISETDNSPLHNEILTIAQARGLPVVLPLMDLTDTQNIQIPDLWGRFIEPIAQASQRYTPENIVIIRVSKNTDVLSNEEEPQECGVMCVKPEVNIDWHIITAQSEKVESGQQYEGSDDVTLIKTVMSDITENIVKRYALTTESNHELVIDVANIDSLPKYVAVSEFLEKMSAIRSVKLIHAKGHNRRFQLTLMGAPETLFASLKLNKKLKQYIDPLVGQAIDDIPVFLWGTE